MRERLQGLTRVFAGCAVLALVSCGAGADRTGATTESDAVASSQEAMKSNGAPKVTPQNSGTTAGLIAISALNARVAWASGRFGTFAVTANGGKTWNSGVVPGAETAAVPRRRGGQREGRLPPLGSHEPTGPLHSLAHLQDDGRRQDVEAPVRGGGGSVPRLLRLLGPLDGLDFADSVGDRFPAVRTFDGHTWHDYGDHLPTPLPGESGFASGGTCIATQGHRRAWITTGVPPPTPDALWTTRVFFSTDRGRSWGVATAPITAGPGPDSAGGGFSIAFRDARHGILGGGDLGATGVVNNFARSRDGGRTWELTTRCSNSGRDLHHRLRWAWHGPRRMGR